MRLNYAQIVLRRFVMIGLFISVFWGSFLPPQSPLMWFVNAMVTIILYIVLLSLQAGSDLFLQIFGWILVGAGLLLALNLAFGIHPDGGLSTGIRLMLYTFLVALYLHLMRAIRMATRPPWVRFVLE